MRGNAQRDEGVTRRGAQTFARTVGGQQPADAERRRPDQREGQLRDRGHGVSHTRDGFGAAQPVRDVPAHEAQHRGRSGVQPVEQPELHVTDVKCEQEVDRQERRDHLGGDVREQRNSADSDNRAWHATQLVAVLRP